MTIRKRNLRGGVGLEISIFADSPTGEMKLEGPQSANVGRHGGLRGVNPTFVRINPPNKPGTYRLTIGGTDAGSVSVSRADARGNITRGELSRGWNGTIKMIDWPSGTGVTVQEEYRPSEITPGTKVTAKNTPAVSDPGESTTETDSSSNKRLIAVVGAGLLALVGGTITG